MLIQVIRSDNQYDYIQDFMLDRLIEAKEIVKFRRSTGWVTIGTHSVRKGKREKAVKENDKTAAKNSTFTTEYRKAYLSSLEPF